ncbi:hypothetical protein P5V15_010763 [Pogonomyrmex californicus]
MPDSPDRLGEGDDSDRRQRRQYQWRQQHVVVAVDVVQASQRLRGTRSIEIRSSSDALYHSAFTQPHHGANLLPAASSPLSVSAATWSCNYGISRKYVWKPIELGPLLGIPVAGEFSRARRKERE